MNDQINSITSRRQELGFLKSEIMRILGWDDLQWGEFQYEEGLNYLEHYIEDREHQLARNRIFWNWWRNMWAFRDESLLINKLDQLQRECAIEVYRDVHDGKKLASDIHPNRALIDQTYAQMIDDFTRDELRRKRGSAGANITTT